MQATIRYQTLTRSIAAFTMVIAMAFLAGCDTPPQPLSSNVPTAPPMPAEVETVITDTGQKGLWSYPTSPPQPTDSPPTLTANASMTVIPVPTEVPGLEETIVALATSSPYPTAGQPAIQKGEPYVVSVRRGALYYEMRLAGDSYLAGENGRATITVRNEGKETLFVEENKIELLDEQGNSYDSWTLGAAFPFEQPVMRGPGPGSYSRPLQAGGTITETRHFQLPPAEASKGRIYSLSASTGLSRPMPTHPDRSDMLVVPLELEPVPLKVSTPRPDQYLKSELKADGKGYTLRVTDGEGKPVEGAWSVLVAYFSNGFSASPVRESSNGVWSGVWPQEMRTPLRLEAWVGARGYVAVGIRETVSEDR